MISSLLFAELYKPNRIVEFGVDAKIGASNGYFTPEEVLVKDLKFDLQKISNGISDSGLGIDFVTNERFFFNLNISDNFRVSSFFNVEGSGYANIDHDFFKMLADGIRIGRTLSFDVEAVADVFAVWGLSYQTMIKGYRVKASPAYVVPLLYLKKCSGTVTYTSTKDGSLRADISAPVEVYTVVNAKRYIEHDFETTDISNDITNALRRGGFDLTLEVERPLTRTFEAGAYTRIPIVPGRLNHSMKKTFTASFEIDNVLDYIESSEEIKDLVDKASETSYDSASAKVFRPFRLGLEGAWRPFGRYVTFRPKLGFAVRNPYSSAMMFYPEYALDADVTFLNIIGISAGTAYENKAFAHSLGFMLNARVFEFIVKAQVRGTDFVNSFKTTGAGAYAGIRFGF